MAAALEPSLHLTRVVPDLFLRRSGYSHQNKRKEESEMCASPKDVLIARLQDELRTKEAVTKELCRIIAMLQDEILAAKAGQCADL